MRYDVEDVKKIQDKAYKLGYAEWLKERTAWAFLLDEEIERVKKWERERILELYWHYHNWEISYENSWIVYTLEEKLNPNI
jgi:hypothetical protein